MIHSHPRCRRSSRLAGFGLAAALLVAACGSDSPSSSSSQSTGDGPAPVEETTIRIVGIKPTAKVAAGEGFFENLDVQFAAESASVDEVAVFLAGEADIVGMSPWTAANYINEGEDLVLLSAAGGITMVNGVVVAADKADEFASIEDLVGKRLGIPGLGSDTWLAFQVLMDKLYGIDAQNDFELVTAEPGALFALVESGQVDGALLFSGQTATALALPDQFAVIMSLADLWEQETGETLLVATPVVKRSWLEANHAAVERYFAGLDKASAWIKENADEFREGGKYEETGRLKGWLSNENATNSVIDMIVNDNMLPGPSDYTQAWIDANYAFIEAGAGVLYEGDPPAKETLFAPATG